jgi:hypothetical protein
MPRLSLHGGFDPPSDTNHRSRHLLTSVRPPARRGPDPDCGERLTRCVADRDGHGSQGCGHRTTVDSHALSADHLEFGGEIGRVTHGMQVSGHTGHGREQLGDARIRQAGEQAFAHRTAVDEGVPAAGRQEYVGAARAGSACDQL